MSDRQYLVAASARIAAPPKQLYDLVADYRAGFPRIMPGHITDLTIERGGVGAGTIIRFQLRLLGRARTIRAAISEPEPGRVLAGTNLEGTHAVTTITVAGTSDGRASDVTIATRLAVRAGVAGTVTRLLTARTLRSMYKEQLARLAGCTRLAGTRLTRPGFPD